MKWWAGRKLLVMLSFPSNFTEQQAVAVIDHLQQLPAVEKVVAASASNLEFMQRDFARAYAPSETIPDVAKRGFDKKRFNRPAYVPPDREDLGHMPHATNRLIVQWKDEFIWRAAQTGFGQQMAALHQAAGCRVVRDIRRSDTGLSQLLEFDGDADALAGKLRRYMNSGWVESAQPDFIYHAASAAPTPNDPVYNASPGPQWSLPLIRGPEAWGQQQGDPSVIIAVADSGAPVNAAPLFPAVTPHPDFQDPSHTLWNIWSGQNTNVPGESRNFHDGNNDVSDTWSPYYHGTLVASIIGARSNNALGMSGVAWNVSLMILKVLGSCGTFAGCTGSQQEAFSSSVSGAISYASRYHAAAINCSFFGSFIDKDGIPTYDPVVNAAIDAAREGSGMLVVAAAVNAGSSDDNNTYVNTPNMMPLDNVISVGATTIDDQKASYSNFGPYRVDLGAPGGSSTGGPMVLGLKPTFNGNSADPANYNFDWGCSFAAPHVSGAVALVKSKYSWENYGGIKDRILMGVEHVLNTNQTQRFDGIFRTKGRLDLFRALHSRTLIRNISTRAFVGSGEQVLIGGFTISGDAGAPSLKVCVRGLGPSVGVNPVLPNPKIQIFHSTGKSSSADVNDDWVTDVNHGQLAGYGLEPSNPLEAAMIRDLLPGAYTVVVSASPGTPLGIGLVDITELSGGTSERSRLINLSTRCFVGTNDYVAIAGTIVGNSADDPALPDRRVLMLGRGPSLSNAGISNPLPDPVMELHNSSALLQSNDTWTDIDGPYVPFPNPALAGRIMSGNALEEELVSAGFFECDGGNGPQVPCSYPAGSTLESAMWPTLRSGAYTAILSGTGATPTGIGLIEFYEY